MKKYILLFAIFGSVAGAFAAASSEPITLPDLKVVDNWELVTQRVLPEYPMDLQRAGIEGRVRLDIVVNRDGRVKSVSVLDSDNEKLTTAVRKAVWKWKFVPVPADVQREHWHAHASFRFVMEENA